MRQSLSEKMCEALSQVTGSGLHFQRSRKVLQMPFKSNKNIFEI
jgi:hypothetical protein